MLVKYLNINVHLRARADLILSPTNYLPLFFKTGVDNHFKLGARWGHCLADHGLTYSLEIFWNLKTIIYFQAQSQNYEKRPLASSSPSVRMETLGSLWTDFYEIWYFSIFRKSVQKIQVSLKSDKNKGYFTWRPIYMFIIYRSNQLRIRNVSGKCCGENQSTDFMFNSLFFFENHAVYELMWENIAKPDRPQMTIWRVCIARWITKATDTHLEYAILIYLPLQQ